ncbi:MAG: hypothetical protein ACK4F7_05770 [Inhella sp.]
MNKLLAFTLLATSLAVHVQSKDKGWEFGAVLDITHTTRPLAAGLRDQGLQLGHSDLTASGPLGPWLRGHVGAVFATHDGKLESGIEEAFVETTALPAGLQLRAGRFASQIGYLNQQHLHADDFSERPLLYRSFFGGHWNDDGLRLNLTLPTSFYWMVGAEGFRGKQLVEEIANAERKPGALTLVTKLGADINRSHSWQLGLSTIHNRREAAVQDDHDHDHDEHAGHSHAHGASFSGRKTWMVDATWKWAPNGNNRDQQVRVTFEAARITDLNRYADSQDKHEANAISAVWRFKPSWEVGVRSDWLRVSQPHGDHFHKGLLREQSVMLAWKPSHMQMLRLQYSRQHDAVELENPSKRSVYLQYVIAFGAHGAHSF